MSALALKRLGGKGHIADAGVIVNAARRMSNASVEAGA